MQATLSSQHLTVEMTVQRQQHKKKKHIHHFENIIIITYTTSVPHYFQSQLKFFECSKLLYLSILENTE